MVPRLIMDPVLVQKMISHCIDEDPYEACGIFTGKDGRVLNAYATDSMQRHGAYYQVDTLQQKWVLADAKRRGEQLIGIYHSHPKGPSDPSQTDIRMAVHYPEAIRVIVSLMRPPKVRAYSIRQGKVEEVAVESQADSGGEWHDLRRQR